MLMYSKITQTERSVELQLHPITVGDKMQLFVFDWIYVEYNIQLKFTYTV